MHCGQVTNNKLHEIMKMMVWICGIPYLFEVTVMPMDPRVWKYCVFSHLRIHMADAGTVRLQSDIEHWCLFCNNLSNCGQLQARVNQSGLQTSHNSALELVLWCVMHILMIYDYNMIYGESIRFV